MSFGALPVAQANPQNLNARILQHDFQDLLTFKPEDAYRCDAGSGQWEALNLSSLFLRVVFYILEYFSGGIVVRDNAAFDALYRDKIIEPLTALQAASGVGKDAETLNERAEMLQTLMKVHAKISVSRWGSNLRNNANLRNFEDGLIAAQTGIKAEMAERGVALAPDLARWVNSNLEQRRFAAFCNSDLPYLWKEVPAGAVVLTNYRSMEIGIKLKGFKLTWGQWLFAFKTIFCKLFTGKIYTHAELSLGKGETFDLDKKQGTVLDGEVKIQNRIAGKEDRICYHDIFVPKQQEMVNAYNEMVRVAQDPDEPMPEVENFEQLWEMIGAEAKAKAPLIHATPWDICKVALPLSRPEGYDNTQAWQPGRKQYGCSALITALMGKYGIDIGAQFNKQAQNVSPANFSASNFYQRYFVANN